MLSVIGPILRAIASAGILLASGAVHAASVNGPALLDTHCGSCHARQDDGTLSRIGRVRQTPEGWDMTIQRMVVRYGLELPAADRHSLVKYLADSRGLAPTETAPFRYALERRPSVIESYPDPAVGATCAVCHSYARAALQGRDASEWLLVAHQHVGQFFSTEYQNGMRQRDWWAEVSTQFPGKLAALYPLESTAWTEWLRHPRANLEGNWRIAGHRPGVGDYTGSARITSLGGDEYGVTYQLQYAAGASLIGTGTAVVYTGYEWRGTTKLGAEAINEVFALSADGNAMQGRWYLTDSDEVGATLRAERLRPGYTAIMAIQPTFLRAGTDATVTVHGMNLDGDVSLGDGIMVSEIEQRSPDTVQVRVSVAPDAADGGRLVQVGASSVAGGLTVFHRVDSVRVEPAEALARVGGGAVAPVTAQFEAVAYANGPDGESGTADDMRIGVMPATWQTDNFGEIAKAKEDARFAGAIQDSGLFVPNVAGPNAQRGYRTNNWGNLTVKGTVDDGGRPVEGTAHLLVTIQRWVDAPIN
jgi:quinohemoprotein amine dehydrogenase